MKITEKTDDISCIHGFVADSRHDDKIHGSYSFDSNSHRCISLYSMEKALLILLVPLMFYGVTESVYSHNIYKNYISDKQYQNLKTPYWHWIMMGLQNNGYYSPDDYEYTRSYEINERSAACRKRRWTESGNWACQVCLNFGQTKP